MATVYAPPASVGPVPDFDDYKDENNRYDFNAHLAAENKWIEKVCDEARRRNPKCKIAGKMVYFGVGDGNAVYVIWNNTSLVHCPVGDNWSIPDAHARGLRAADLRVMAQDRLSSAF